MESHLKHEHKDSAWLLLGLISGHVQMQDPKFAMTYFHESIHTKDGVSYLEVQVWYSQGYSV